MPAPAPSGKDSPFRTLLARVADEVHPRLLEVLDESQTRARSYGDEVSHMVGAVRSLCARGGKRLRPALCVVGGLCHDEKFVWAPAIDAGVSLELLQAYFLIHDDWMDQDSERRGGPTAHVELEKIFESKALGERSAILAGDHAIALASQHLARLSVSPARLKRAMEQFAEMQLAAVAGQQLDVRGKAPNPELTYELKTASYTVKGPLLLGAVLAGARQKTLDALDAYSLPAGVAFQLRDDLIGVFGDPKLTGKPRGGDLKEGKNTVLVQQGLRLLSGRSREALSRVLGNPEAGEAQLGRVIASLEECGARASVEARIDELKADALAAAHHSSFSKKGRRLLESATFTLTERKT